MHDLHLPFDPGASSVQGRGSYLSRAKCAALGPQPLARPPSRLEPEILPGEAGQVPTSGHDAADDAGQTP